MQEHSRVSPQSQLCLDDLSLPERRGVRIATSLRKPCVDLAYILGAWAAHTECGSSEQRHLSFASSRQDVIRMVGEALRRISDDKPKIERTCGPAGCIRIRFLCPLLSAHVHTITANNARVPWEHLGTKNEQATFLQGLFDHAGWLSLGSSPGMGINKVGGASLLHDIARILYRAHIYPLVLDTSLPTLKLRERSDWITFREKIGLSASADQRDLNQLCTLRGGRRKFTVADYLNVIRLHENKLSSASEIALRTAVPVATVRDWTIRGQVPRVVRRFSALSAAEQRHEHPESIAFLFRSLGVSSSTARSIGTDFDLEAVKKTLQGARQSLSTLYGDDNAIRSLFTRA